MNISTYIASNTKKGVARGFTLIETMVAISVLVVAITAPLTLASQSLFAAVYAKDQTTAFYLAQEALEIVRNKRDSNMLSFMSGESTNWLDGIPIDSGFYVDIPNDTMVVCTESCLQSKLRHDGVFYNHSTGDNSRFSRNVSVTINPNLTDEAIVVVTVEWQTGSFNKRTISLHGQLYNWVPGAI